MTDYFIARSIMGKNFIGKDEIKSLSKFSIPEGVPPIKFSEKLLKKIKNDYILILSLPINLLEIRDIFGINPDISEPCLYNQDWYLKEKFSQKPLKYEWHLIRKKIQNNSRGKNPLTFKGKKLPSCTLAAFTFFCNYLLNKEILWKDDFIWCNDKDHNGDQIYVGRYKDIKGINKNGFNIHRHLQIRKIYGLADSLDF